MKKRIPLLVAVVAVMVVMLAMSVAPAFAAPPDAVRDAVCQAARERVEGTQHGLIPLFCFA